MLRSDHDRFMYSGFLPTKYVTCPLIDCDYAPRTEIVEDGDRNSDVSVVHPFKKDVVLQWPPDEIDVVIVLDLLPHYRTNPYIEQIVDHFEDAKVWMFKVAS